MPSRVHGLPKKEIEVEFMLPQDRSVFMKVSVNSQVKEIKNKLWHYLVSQGLELSGAPCDYVFSYSHELNVYEIIDESVLLCSLDIYQYWTEDSTFMKWLELRPRNRILCRHDKDMISMVQALTGITPSELGIEGNVEIECARKNFTMVRQSVEKIRNNYDYYYGPRITPSPLPIHLQKRCRDQMLFIQFFFPTGSTKSQLSELFDKSADFVRDEMFPKDPVKRTLYGLTEDAKATDYVLKVAGISDYITGDTPFVDFVHVRECLIRKEHVDLWYVGKPCVPGDEEPKLDTPLLDPAERYSLLQSDLTINGKLHTNIAALSLWEINQKLRIRIFGCENVADIEEGLSYVYVQCTLYHGTTPLSAPGCTKQVAYSASPTWYQWLTYDIALRNVPQDARIHIQVKAITKGQRKKSVTEENKPKSSKKNLQPIKSDTLKGENSTSVGEDICIAWINLSLIDFRSCLKTGKMTLSCWDIDEDIEDGTMALPDSVVSQNPVPSSVLLKIELDEFMFPVVVPSYPPPLADLDQGPIPSPSEQSRLEALMYNVDALTGLNEKEKEMIWKYRRFLKNYDQALPKLLQSVDWCHQENVEEIVQMLDVWAPPRMEVILELLSCRTPCRPIRNYAVSCLEKLDIHTVSTYLLQLVEALKYETYHDSPLARFLLKRALENREFGHYFFWHLRSTIERLEHRVRIGLVLEAFIRGCGDEQRFRLLSQVRACTILRGIAQNLKSEKYQNDAQRKAYLLEALHTSDLPESFSPVFNPYIMLGKIIPRECTFFDSKKKPLLLAFENGDSSNSEKRVMRVIFKHGDDITQDMVTIQMLKLMESMWQQSALDLYMMPYGCIRTGKNCGMIEFVDAMTLADIMLEHGGVTGVFRADLLKEWLSQQNTYKVDLDRALQLFTMTCAGYCVATYVLGIGDRHSSNIMVKRNGAYFHIDFGHFLGNVKYFEVLGLNIKRERVPFVFTSTLAFVMGGRDGELFKQFESVACRAFSVLRKHSHLLVNTLSLLLKAGMPELQTTKDIEYLHSTLLLHKSESQAANHFQSLINDTLKDKSTALNFLAHTLKHL